MQPLNNPQPEQNEPRIKKRSAWAAVLLSFLCIVLGYLYCGKPKRGIIIYAISTLLFSFLLGVLNFFPNLYLLLLIIIVSIIFTVFIIVDLIKIIRTRKEHVLQPYNKWYIYVLVIFSAGYVNIFLGVFHPSSYNTPTGSMFNTVLIGDRVFANDLAYGLYNPLNKEYAYIFSKPKRGDVVSFKFPGFRDEVKPQNELLYLKRIIALPGDTVTINNGIIYVNNSIYNFPETANINEYRDTNLDNKPDPTIFPKGSGWNIKNYGPIYTPKKGDNIILTTDNIEKWKVFIEREDNIVLTPGNKILINGIESDSYLVKRNYYFMVGDNFYNSLDSRHIGFISENLILNKITMIYWSWDSQIPIIEFGRLLNSIRWNRIGKEIQ